MAVKKTPENKNIFRSVILVVLALFVLVLITTGVSYFVVRNISGNNAIVKGQTSKNHVTYDAGEFLTNLSDRGYIKLSLVYLLDDKIVEKELDLKESEIRDKIFTILRSKKNDSVKDSQGMEELRKHIKESLNDTLNDGIIVDVYFTSIIVN
ncbi:MAG: flagellar basal body-associated FliL family protein [Tepidanaerobacteraceae bacterium]|nr:flagellar basal body-associated FliL family protein [Tepidanaerobacteraceae bacterium]